MISGIHSSVSSFALAISDTSVRGPRLPLQEMLCNYCYWLAYSVAQDRIPTYDSEVSLSSTSLGPNVKLLLLSDMFSIPSPEAEQCHIHISWIGSI
jgi:hypothetical protein